jgi:transaldolase
VFAGRIADTGRDPVPLMTEALDILAEPKAELIWASPASS